LLSVLREGLAVMSVKEGCSHRGMRRVHRAHRMTTSVRLPHACFKVEGRDVKTVEFLGTSRDSILCRVLQSATEQCSAGTARPACCSSRTACSWKKPNATEDEIREGPHGTCAGARGMSRSLNVRDAGQGGVGKAQAKNSETGRGMLPEFSSTIGQEQRRKRFGP